MTRQEFIAYIERDGYSQFGEKNIWKDKQNLTRYEIGEFRYYYQVRDLTKKANNINCWRRDKDESRSYRELQLNPRTGKIKKLKIV